MNSPKKCPLCGSTNLKQVREGVWLCQTCYYETPRKPVTNTKAQSSTKRFRRKGSWTTKTSQIRPLNSRLTGKEKTLLEKNHETALAFIKKQAIPKSAKRIIHDRLSLLVGYKFLPKKYPPQSPPITELGLPSFIVKTLEKQGISRLFEFQVQARNAILNGMHTAILAPTGMGKTEAFLLPLLEYYHKSPVNDLPYVMLVYPTKALAHDQYLKIMNYLQDSPLRCMIFDGDTPQQQRENMYELPPHILITNFDMIHLHMHLSRRFQGFIENLRWLVIDEVHTLTGSFGTAVYFILMRMKRLNPNLKFIASTATLRNPKEFLTTLLGITNLALIQVKGYQKSSLHLLMMYPTELSMYWAITRHVKSFLMDEQKTLVFANTHKTAEALYQIFRSNKIHAGIHRGGLSKTARRKVEHEFKQGSLPALIATPTIELGIDIGQVDAVVSMLIDVTRMQQRLGRAGRKGQEAIGVIELRNDDPISQYYAHHPQDYFTDVREGFIEPMNFEIAKYQLLYMAHEKPIHQSELPNYRDLLENLTSEAYLTKKGGFYSLNKKKAYPVMRSYNIRGIGETVRIIESNTNQELGQRSLPMGIRELHPGAIYFLGGKVYKVLELRERPTDWVAIVEKTPYKRLQTQALRASIPTILNVTLEKTVHNVTLKYCDLLMEETVYGYIIKEIMSSKIHAIEYLQEPITYTYETKGIFFHVPEPTTWFMNRTPNPLDPDERFEYLGGSYHAVEHTLIESSNSLTGGGAFEIGGVSLGDTGDIVIYDGAKGGSGLTRLLYQNFSKALTRTYQVLTECPCKLEQGCPRCTHSYQCGNNNHPLNKHGAIEILKLILPTTPNQENK